MKKLLPVALLVIASLMVPQLATPAYAHIPVILLDTDTTPKSGPLLVDGTVSFAIQASFQKTGQKKAFRAALKKGDELAVEYLIIDKRPENALANTKLPLLVITSPSGKKMTIKFNERTEFYYSRLDTNFLYLSRYTAPAEAGIYEFVLTARAPAAITLAVGKKEIAGQVLRGSASATSAANVATPKMLSVKTENT